mmetsp:Transcript_11834/g.18327  ORF Transcript_11834/g.18327 Transcript_11834/m.18327 type:complete len:247 (+) Transcript_11834:344-1084(+)
MSHLLASNATRIMARRAYHLSAVQSTTGRRIFYNSISLQHNPSSSRLSRIISFSRDRPFAFNLFLATSKTCAADIFVQTTAERKKFSEIDWRRNAIFVVFGFVYLGGFQWWLLINKFKQWFPTMERFGQLSFSRKLKYKAGIRDAIKMIAFDVIIHSPMFYFPTYYTVKESIGGCKWDPSEWVVDGVEKYRKNMLEDLTAMVTVTIPSDCIQVVLPIHMRMVVRHFISFFWTSYISFSRGSIENKE